MAPAAASSASGSSVPKPSSMKRLSSFVAPAAFALAHSAEARALATQGMCPLFYRLILHHLRDELLIEDIPHGRIKDVCNASALLPSRFAMSDDEAA
jgi:hypothetical protein